LPDDFRELQIPLIPWDIHLQMSEMFDTGIHQILKNILTFLNDCLCGGGGGGGGDYGIMSKGFQS
jgi:hypothetical protein